MEPKVSMSWFAVAQVLGLVVLGLGGWGPAGMWVGVGVLVTCVFLNALYLVQRRASGNMPPHFRKRRPEVVPRHRSQLDRCVALQWLAAALLGGGGAVLLDGLRATPMHHLGIAFEVLVIGWVVLWVGIYVSSAVEW
jgi:hypothetical protein